ncbi:MAG: hypothetical protein K0R48_988 [Gammaproteobacteria bacterium]|jgi:hypothetical protein|nr:hypothetical protein [Gammaproteobacteria bacterium]
MIDDDYEKPHKSIQTTGEALQAVSQLCRRYIVILEKIITIKNKPPEKGEAVFGRSGVPQQKASLQGLKDAASILLQHTVEIGHQLEQKHRTTYSVEHMNEPYLNYVLLNVITEAITEMEACYAGQTTSFAILLNELMLLSHDLRSQLDVNSDPAGETESISKEDYTRQNTPQKKDEKMIYIRVFHRDLPKLGETADGMNCIPILLEMVKFCEKNGLAVYSEWALAERSLRNDSYGFFSACIHVSQDVSLYTAPKRDRYLDCALLTIQKVELSQLRQFKHRDKIYWVQKDKLIEV